MRSRSILALMIAITISSSIWMGTIRVEAVVYNWTSPGEFLSCFAHLYGNEYWQSKGLNFAAVEIDNSGGVESESRTISVAVQGYTNVALKNVSLAPREKRTVYLNPIFTADLKMITAPISANATLRVLRSDGTESYRDTKTITLLPVNYLYWSKDSFLRTFSIVFSTPTADPIRRLVSVANKTTPFEAMSGYKEMKGFTKEEVVEGQMRAIYNTMKALGVTYVNSSLTLYETKAQTIRITRQMFTDYSGNALEIALPFVSALESVDLKPYLIFMTGHVVIGVAEWSSSDQLLYLDTSMIKSSYEDARARGKQLVDQKKSSDPAYLVVDVYKLRKDYKVTSTPYIDLSSPTEFQQKITRLSADIDAAKTAISQAKTKVDSIRDKVYDKAESKAFRQKAIDEYTLAVTSFNLGQYVESKSHAEQATENVSKAESTQASPPGTYMILIVVAAAVGLGAGFILFLRKKAKSPVRPEEALEAPAEKATAGQPQTKSCPKCSASNAPTAKFCETCGAEL
ncbi:MAG: zinc ribbon domain-containing protein [archaeon]